MPRDGERETSGEERRGEEKRGERRQTRHERHMSACQACCVKSLMDQLPRAALEGPSQRGGRVLRGACRRHGRAVDAPKADPCALAVHMAQSNRTAFLLIYLVASHSKCVAVRVQSRQNVPPESDPTSATKRPRSHLRFWARAAATATTMAVASSRAAAGPSFAKKLASRFHTLVARAHAKRKLVRNKCVKTKMV